MRSLHKDPDPYTGTQSSELRRARGDLKGSPFPDEGRRLGADGIVEDIVCPEQSLGRESLTSRNCIPSLQDQNKAPPLTDWDPGARWDPKSTKNFLSLPSLFVERTFTPTQDPVSVSCGRGLVFRPVGSMFLL